MMGKLEMRHDFTVTENRRAGAGAEGQNHLDAPPRDRAKTLDIGIVENAHRLAPAAAQRLLQIKAAQGFGAEIGGGNDPPVPNIAQRLIAGQKKGARSMLQNAACGRAEAPAV